MASAGTAIGGTTGGAGRAVTVGNSSSRAIMHGSMMQKALKYDCGRFGCIEGADEGGADEETDDIDMDDLDAQVTS